MSIFRPRVYRHGKGNEPYTESLHESPKYVRCVICGRWRSKHVKIDESGTCGECAEEYPTKQSLALKPQTENPK